MIEADRVLVYLSFFLAAFLIAQTDQKRQRFAEGLAISLALIAFLALASRLLPDLIDVNSFGSGPRVRYPLGYWNANGLAFGIGVALLLWMSRRSSWTGLRGAAVASMPVLLLALYFTYSRGGLLSLLVASGCLIALSHDRLWMLATLAIGALGALPAVLAVQARPSLADNFPSQTTIDEGQAVALILLAGIALAVLLFVGLRRIERRRGPLTGKAVALSRNPQLLKGVALLGALLALGAAVAVGGQAWDRFSSPDLQFPSDPQHHFSQLSSAGRHDFWRVAGDAFGEKPALGHGAGTFEFSWEQLRSIDQPVHDAHSVYLEAFAELGLVGGLLVLFLVGTLLWTGFSAWRAASGPRQELHAALLATCVAFAVGAAIDWFWEIAALGAIFFLASGALVAARCAQLARVRSANGEQLEARRFGLAVAGVAAAWISAIALVGPLLVDREIKASQEAAAANNLLSAADHAETARSIEPWAASPYVQLGLIAEVQGDYATAATYLSRAIDREDHNWQLFYLRSRVEEGAAEAATAQGREGQASRHEDAALADLEQARQLNPRAPELQEEPPG